MSAYAIHLHPDAKAALAAMNAMEFDFALSLLDEIANHPSRYAEPADPDVYAGGGMVAKAIMPMFGDCVYFAVVFRFSADETALIITSILAFPPPVEDEPGSA